MTNMFDIDDDAIRHLVILAKEGAEFDPINCDIAGGLKFDPRIVGGTPICNSEGRWTLNSENEFMTCLNDIINLTQYEIDLIISPSGCTIVSRRDLDTVIIPVLVIERDSNIIVCSITIAQPQGSRCISYK